MLQIYIISHIKTLSLVLLTSAPIAGTELTLQLLILTTSSMAERLHSLEALLPVVKAACANVHRDGGILHELALAPLAVLPDVADVAVHVSETETETLPINVWHGFYYLSFNP